MEYVYLILQMLGGMGCFLVGMEIMSESMSRLAHGSLKNLLNKTANNRIAGVGIGATVTAIIQSSAATTVMVVGLVNAGIMTLFQATAIIMGANIGTTITAWIASLGTIDISKFFFLLAVIGAFMMMLCKKDNVKTVGSILAGLGLIFVGLAYMSESMGNDLIKDAIAPVFEAVKNPVLLVIVGAVVTALIQSSSAVTSIIIVLASSGIIVGGTGDGVYFVIIGSNIGTCVTALLSSIGATENARRAAVIHLLFNCFGAVIFSFFLLGWKWAGSSFTGVVLDRVFPPMPSGKPNYQFQIAFFHTLFNVICTCIFLPFAKGFVWLANRIVREKKKKPQMDRIIGDLDARLLLQPSVALSHLYQEVGKMLAYAMGTLDLAFGAFLEKDTDAKEKVQERNKKLAEANREAVQYLVKLSASAPAFEDEKAISSMHYVLNDIVRVGELADNVTKYTDHYVNDPLVFSEEFLTMIKNMYDKIGELYTVCDKAFLERDYMALKEVDVVEDVVDKMRRELVNQHIKRLNEGRCQPQSASVFINLVGNLERAADHLTYIAHSIE